jgi:two-component system C4-dicarboxylate transport response regulator DctD
LTVLFEAEGFQVRAYLSAQAFLDQAQGPCGCLITDIQMPTSGLELLAEVKARRPDLPVIVISGRLEPGRIARSLAGGAAAVLEKPCAPEALIAAVGQALAF